MCIASRRTFLAGAAGLISAPLAHAGERPLPSGAGTTPMQAIDDTVWVAKIAPTLWLHTTLAHFPGGMVCSNGIVQERVDGSVLIDTGVTPYQADALVEWSAKTLSTPIRLAVATHYHSDRTGGIPALKRRGIQTLALPLSCTLAKQYHEAEPDPITALATDPVQLNPGCELYYPGGGHTRDTVVVWFPVQKVLFGGCLLKSATATDLGNLADAVVDEWPTSLNRLKARYPDITLQIPGHGPIGGNAIERTDTLVRAWLAKAPPKERG